MMMVVELSATALADELAEEDVAELDTELDLLEVALAVMEEEELSEVLEDDDEDEAMEDDEEISVVNEDDATEVEDLLLEVDEETDEEDLALTETMAGASLFFIESVPLTKKAESTVYERSVVLLTIALDCADLR